MNPPVSALIAGLLLSFSALNAQQRTGIDPLLQQTGSNLQYGINEQQISRSQLLIRSAGLLPKTGVFAENEDLRPSDNKGILKIGVTQSIAWPGLYAAQKKVYSNELAYYQLNTKQLDADIRRRTRAVYYQLWFLQDKQKLFMRLDSLYRSLAQAATLKVKTGDSPGLDSIAANVRLQEIEAQRRQITSDMQIQQRALQQLLNTTVVYLAEDKKLEKLTPLAASNSLHPMMALRQQQIDIANASVDIARNENRPEFSGRFFSQRLYGMRDPFSGFSVSAAFPIFGRGAMRQKVKAAQQEVAVQQKQLAYQQQLFETEKEQAAREVEKNNSLLQFYENAGLRQADAIIRASGLAYRAGEISFAELSQYLSQAIDIQRNYLEQLNAYNQSVIHYDYFLHP